MPGLMRGMVRTMPRLPRCLRMIAIVLLPQLLLSLVACRAERVAVLRDAQVRPTIAGSTTAGYFVLENLERDTLVVDSVTVGGLATAELHETTIDDAGVARMRPVGVLVVPPDSTATLRPGGLHLMLMDVGRELSEGERLPMTLWLRGGRTISASAEVKVPGG